MAPVPAPAKLDWCFQKRSEAPGFGRGAFLLAAVWGSLRWIGFAAMIVALSLLQFRGFELVLSTQDLQVERSDMAARKTVRKSSRKKPAYQRILLKLSGESLQGPLSLGVHGETLQSIARELKKFARWVWNCDCGGRRKYFSARRPKGFEIRNFLQFARNRLQCFTVHAQTQRSCSDSPEASTKFLVAGFSGAFPYGLFSRPYRPFYLQILSGQHQFKSSEL